MHPGPAPAAHPARPCSPPARSSQPNAPNPSARPSHRPAPPPRSPSHCATAAPLPCGLAGPSCVPRAALGRALPAAALGRRTLAAARHPAARPQRPRLRAQTRSLLAPPQTRAHAPHPLLQPSLLPMRRELDSQLASAPASSGRWSSNSRRVQTAARAQESMAS